LGAGDLDLQKINLSCTGQVCPVSVPHFPSSKRRKSTGPLSLRGLFLLEPEPSGHSFRSPPLPQGSPRAASPPLSEISMLVPVSLRPTPRSAARILSKGHFRGTSPQSGKLGRALRPGGSRQSQGAAGSRRGLGTAPTLHARLALPGPASPRR
jgi:hypothetical protein